MIIFENHTYQVTSGRPNENYLEGLECEQPKWVIDDNSELAGKIFSTLFWEAVEDEDGNLTDIIPAPSLVLEQSEEDKTAELMERLDEIDRLAIRPLRAIAAGTATDEDREILAELERQADKIRKELAELSGETAVADNG